MITSITAKCRRCQKIHTWTHFASYEMLQRIIREGHKILTINGKVYERNKI